MRQIQLIALNFLREARWYLAVMLIWVVGIAAMMWIGTTRHSGGDDVRFMIRQETGYGVFLTFMLGASAINNDRKTRRILSILSKAVERWEYLAGLLLGTLLQALIYFGAVTVCASLVAARAGIETSAVAMLPSLLLASILAASVGLFCSTWLHPLFAAMIAGSLLSLQFFGERALGQWSAPLSAYLPLTWAFGAVMGTRSVPSILAGAAVVAIVEIATFLWLASLIFERRDIAVAVD